MEATDRVRAILSFVQTATFGSFAAAARSQGISAAAVSKNVAGLEMALGVRLLNRTTRSMQLTPEGEAFLVQARTAIEALNTAIDDVATQRAHPSGRVRLSTSIAFGQRFIVPLLPGFIERYPRIQVGIDFEDRSVDLVREGYDFVIRGGLIPNSDFIVRRIFSLHTALVASPAYLQRRGVPQHPDELVDHAKIMIRYLNGRIVAWDFEQEVPLIPDGQLTVSDPLAAVDAAVLGLGIAQVGIHHAWPHFKSGALKAVFIAHYSPGNREMVIQYPHRSLQAQRVRVLIDYLLEELAKIEALQMTPEDLLPWAA